MRAILDPKLVCGLDILSTSYDFNKVVCLYLGKPSCIYLCTITLFNITINMFYCSNSPFLFFYMASEPMGLLR
jgi:hypothetical protein